MRNNLSKINGTRARFEGTFVRFGSKKNWNGYPEPTILLKEVKSLTNGEIMTDHLWFKCGKRFDSLHLKENDIVRFDARVSSYEKGYKGYRDIDDYKPIETDYRLSFPTNMTKVSNNSEIQRLI
jgi:hypothetical protein